MCIAGKTGTKIKLRLEFLEGRLYLHFPKSTIINMLKFKEF
jgi:hypothetical protein